MRAASTAFMTAEESKPKRRRTRSQTGLEWTPAEKHRWQGAARAEDKPFSVWARELLDAAALSKVGSPKPIADPASQAALFLLLDRYPALKDQGDVLRHALLTAAAREERHRGTAFLVEPESSGERARGAGGTDSRPRDRARGSTR